MSNNVPLDREPPFVIEHNGKSVKIQPKWKDGDHIPECYVLWLGTATRAVVGPWNNSQAAHSDAVDAAKAWMDEPA